MWPFRPIRTCAAAAVVRCAALLVAVALGTSQDAQAQNQLTEPVYHVARETPATEAALASLPSAASASAPGAPFDLTQRPGEHPLGPMIRVSKEILANLDQNVQDYSCTLQKQERVDGDLTDPQQIYMKVGHQPFSVYMYFLKPYQGREVLYVDGRNENKMLVLECGFKRHLGQMQLDPTGMLAMRGQKYPITKVGIRNLTSELIAIAEAETQFGECQVTTDPNIKIGDRATTMIRIEHPTPRKNFRAYITRIFIDNELRVPVHYDTHLWPEAPGQAPPLSASYTYANLKINNGFTARDFDPSNPEIFNK